MTLTNVRNVNILYTKQSNSGKLSVTLGLITRNLLAPEIVCQCWGPGMTPSSLPPSAVRKGGEGGEKG